jgi:hypothetical protein
MIGYRKYSKRMLVLKYWPKNLTGYSTKFAPVTITPKNEEK